MDKRHSGVFSNLGSNLIRPAWWLSGTETVLLWRSTEENGLNGQSLPGWISGWSNVESVRRKEVYVYEKIRWLTMWWLVKAGFICCESIHFSCGPDYRAASGSHQRCVKSLLYFRNTVRCVTDVSDRVFDIKRSGWTNKNKTMNNNKQPEQNGKHRSRKMMWKDSQNRRRKDWRLGMMFIC